MLMSTEGHIRNEMGTQIGLISYQSVKVIPVCAYMYLYIQMQGKQHLENDT